MPDDFRKPHYCQYYADTHHTFSDEYPQEYGWQTAIHMPRWASRICLEIMAICVKKIQDISEEDMLAEGINYQSHFLSNYFTIEHDAQSPKEIYRKEWTKLYGQTSWEVNPWVWVIHFRRI